MGRKIKRTTEEAAQYFKEQGCELLDEYVGCMLPMDYKCELPTPLKGRGFPLHPQPTEFQPDCT